MSEIKRNEIIYEEGWRDNSVHPDVEDDTVVSTENTEEKSDGSKPLLISIQLIVCLLIALVLFLLKSMGSGYYNAFMDYYHEELEKPVVSRGTFDAYDLSRLFPEEQIQATADEAKAR